eukprot:s919_g9.t1
MTVWGRHVAGAGVHTLSFVDDRTFWSNSFAQLEAAKRLSEEFDDIFQFSCAPSKSTIAFASGSTTGVLAQSLFQYTGASTLTLLGLSYNLDDRCPPALAKLNLTKVQIRMRYIKVVPGSFFHKVMHIRRLVLPMLCWAAGFSVISAEVWQDLRKQVYSVFEAKLLHDAAKCILHEIMGWPVDPHFALIWSHLCAFTRFHCRDPARQVVRGQWFNVLPAAQAILQELGWWHSADGCFLLRADHSGSCRRFELGVDNPSVLQEWLADWHRVRAVRNCRRIRRRLHRDDASLAVGMDLPGPPDPPLCLFAGHVATWKATGSIYLKRAAMASGCSFWWKYPRCKEFSDNDPRLLCACGQPQPSRPHLVWTCPQFAGLQHRPLPTHRIEERLFARVVPETPPAPCVTGRKEMLTAITAAFASMFAISSFGVVATDGSAMDSVAAWSIHIPCLSTGFALGLHGEDQTSFRAEVEAIHVVFLCLCRLWDEGFQQQGTLVVVTDCTAAISMIHSVHGVAPLLSRKLRSMLQLCERRGVHIIFQWVPSHGRHVAKWSPRHFSEEELRKWNEIADRLARDAASQQLQGSARQVCAEARRRAYQWEMGTLQAVERIAAAYLDLDAA